ncbi:D-methionine transport system substrate-binding protein [Virgibacillus natechei]|uniref:Lipoprotein n=1 Tax=Virgibacillus natechei TaxID=1216297 RepID=A0ABS4IGC3_9BACI|nr:MetQ/NlpA family ABC transporter substrate-binding protein [Virgibacillus natechei]MBP1969506.1 D-methionine transport system substrate-binding protein [Virgibacillus natechei]UZD11791.1 MetQ/NlpA family ABC transporter substrate-binding protein [Virgibacillus natechei]
MKRNVAFLMLLVVLVLAACGDGNTDGDTDENTGDNGSEPVEITVGASSTPHAEILEEAKPLLEEEGISLSVEQYQDYVLPNDDLETGDLDANYFQHIPYLEGQIEEIGYDFDYIDGIHIEPMGVYSQNITDIDEIENGTEVILSRSVADHGRVLALFEQNGLITLDEDVEKVDAEVSDIVENPHDLTFSADVDAALLPELYFSEEDALVTINTNYAIDADLNPLEDALFIEDDESPYVNVIAVQSEDIDNEVLNELVNVLQSEEIQTYITETYNGAVVPVGGNN